MLYPAQQRSIQWLRSGRAVQHEIAALRIRLKFLWIKLHSRRQVRREHGQNLRSDARIASACIPEMRKARTYADI